MKEILTAKKVDALFNNCMFGTDESTEGYIKAEGIMVTVGFHPERIAAAKDEILAMLKELPDEYLMSSGGGWTFLNVCNDRHGNQWSGLHKTIEQLALLGIGAGVAEWQMFETRKVMPGGMPYFVVLDTQGD